MRTEITYIAEDGKVFKHAFDCEKYEKQLKQKKEEAIQKESKRLSDAFLLNAGFDVHAFQTENDMNKVLNISWLIFDKHGESKGIKTCGGGLLERYGVNYPPL